MGPLLNLKAVASRVGLTTWLVLSLLGLTSCAPERKSDVTISQPAQAGSGEVKFAVISDLHFQPFLYPDAVVKALLVAEATNWEAILRTNEVAAKPGQDSPLFLIKAGLHNVRVHCPLPRFILCLGDFLGHDFRANCDASGVDAARFAIKTEQFVQLQFAEEFPDTPIFPVLGNNDSDLDDYVSPGPEFLRAFAETWASQVAREGAITRDDFKSQFVRLHGCYEAKLPGLAVRLLALNSDCWCRNGQPLSGTNQDATEMAWLGDRAAASPATLWLAYHVPPGVDGHNFMQPDGGEINLWEPGDESRFLGLLNANRQIKLSFCGHTHRDEFRLLYAEGRPIHLVHIAPSISPCYFNHPAYQLFTANPDGTIRRHETYFTSDLNTAENWEFEYGFTHEPLDTYAERLRPQFTNNYAAQAHCDESLVADLDKYWTNVIFLHTP